MIKLILALILICQSIAEQQDNHLNTQKVIPLNDTIYDGCRQTRTCFGTPVDCDETRTCIIMVAFYLLDDRMIFHLKAADESPRWVAVALSEDATMGEDAAIVCMNGEDSFRAFAGWTTPRGNPSLGVLVDGINQSHIEVIESDITVDGVISCTISQSPIFSINGRDFDLYKETYHVLIASGSNIPNNALARHNIGRLPSAEPVNFTAIQVLTASSTKPILIELHGSFMIIAWIGTASLGSILARYFKNTWIGSQIGGKDIWFMGHTVLMSLTWILHFAAFIMIFVQVDGWSQADNPHAILGVCATAFVFFQPIGGILRPAPDAPTRKYFNIFHYLGGTVAYVIAIIAMFFAGTLEAASLPEEFQWILMGFVILTLLAHSFLTISNFVEYKKIWPSKNVKQIDEDSQSTPRKTIYGIYVLGILGLVIALLVILLN